MYAKLINNVLRRAPNTVEWQGHKVNNPSEDKLKELGYLPVVYTDMPTDSQTGYHYESSWTQTDTEIVQVWTLVEDVVYEEEPTMSDLVQAVERGLNS